MAVRQGGRISRAQLLACGLSRHDVDGWVQSGDLIPTVPRVYAVGVVRGGLFPRLWDGLLFSGPGSYLTGGSAAHMVSLINFPPATVQIATPRDCRGTVEGFRFLARRPDERVVLSSGLPVARLPDLMLELAATEELNVVRHALDVLDFKRELAVADLLAACRPGRAGSRQLRRALERRLPGLSRCRSPLEIAFLLLCEARGLALPLVNARRYGEELDMFWPELNLVVELDGKSNHGTAAQKRSDAVKDAKLRAAGLTVIRLTYSHVHDRAGWVVSMLAGLGVGVGLAAA